MYNLSQIKRGVQNPRAAISHIKSDFHSICDQINRDVRNISGTVMQEDWDNLIILDACRYDLFAECNKFDDDLSKRISLGSHTSVFFKENFQDECMDTVYVSGTPQFNYNSMSKHFLDDYQVWDTDLWDENLKTVPPREMVSAGMKAFKQHPNKRLIIHFLQPHYPFIGETGREIEHRSVGGGGLIDTHGKSIWELLKQGEIDQDTVWQAYRENLEIALPAVNELADKLNGKTVVTSDHGNSFGEWGVYGHPANTFLSSLVEVPWYELSHSQSSRRIITSGDYCRTKREIQSPEKKLKNLGYL